MDATRRARLTEILRTRFKGSQAELARELSLSEGRITQLLDPDGTFGERAARKYEEKLDLPPNWLDKADADDSVEHAAIAPARSATVEEAVERLTELLAGLDDEGRVHAQTALANLARNPSERGAEKAAEMLVSIARIHPREPTPDPTSPQPTTAGESGSVAERAKKPRLTVKEGGGQKMQLGLPFPAKTAANPWDVRQAPQRERDWYKEMRAVPKAANGK